MRKLMISAAVAAASLALVAAPGLAQAQRYDDGYHHHRHHHHGYYNGCDAGRRHDARVGTVLGAIGGGLIGNSIDHGRPVGTILGAGAGAVAGHEIAKNNHRC